MWLKNLNIYLEIDYESKDSLCSRIMVNIGILFNPQLTRIKLFTLIN